MMIRLNTDREDFFSDLTEAEISVELPNKTIAFQYQSESEAASAVKRIWLLGTTYEKIIADLQKERDALVDDLAEAQKK